MDERKYLCIHCHFYQPARGNPLTDEELVEPAAAPYTNWNERITDECYEPNARLGNVDLVSFNLGETLASWMEDHEPATYKRFLQADANHKALYGVGNAVGQTMHHTILPLDTHRDKVTQVRWGKALFQHRFGRQPDGMWLPEMAVDYETLDVLVEEGIKWTMLTDSQIINKPAGAGPFWVETPAGNRIMVFVRDEHLSNDMAFTLGHFGGAGNWAEERLDPEHAGPLTLIATDGETFGHHWPGEELFLHWLLTYEAEAAGYRVVSLAQYAEMVEPKHRVWIRERTAWSSGFGLARWSMGSPDTHGRSGWKGQLRRALDALRDPLDAIYEREVERLGAGDPWDLRNDCIYVLLGDETPDAFLQGRGLDLSDEDTDRLMKLLRAQYLRQRMYTSCAFFFADLDDLSVRYGVASALQAIRLTHEVTGEDLEPMFREALEPVHDVNHAGEPLTGTDIYNMLAEQVAADASV